MDLMIAGSDPIRSKRFSSCPKCPDWLWGPLSLLFIGYRGSFLGVKQAGCKVDHTSVYCWG